ncbi:hypothetical protein [Mesorhizobium sp. B2-3-12]|uniref:hypothetical protein n=1 Tax=Mesorhizobium sp. B2-3-12 TaxID=2589952 RepID=UPI00112BD579|nr:hypothetical protein [Mesorhizobium sp. B2-3-12]TPL87126.1 hypothetical protein FJ948_21765 [Mesorhizobium sp. B2-3-12]
MGEFIGSVLPLSVFFGGAQAVNVYEFGGRYTLAAVFVATCFYALYRSMVHMQIQLHEANKRLWYLANPGRPSEDNPYQ